MEFSTIKLLLLTFQFYLTVETCITPKSSYSYKPVLQVDLSTADADTSKEYLRAIIRGDPCRNVKFYHDYISTWVKTNAIEVCKHAMIIWQTLPPATLIYCREPDFADCRLKSSGRYSFANKECSFSCSGVNGREIKYLSELIHLPTNQNAVEMYQLEDIIGEGEGA